MADTFSPASSGNVNIATYHFKHESDDEVIKDISDDKSVSDGCSDSEDSIFEMSLHYSKEDVHALATKAEKMVLDNTACEKYKTDSQATWQDNHEEYSSDSDYESKISRDCFISSEPNISQRRLSPKRKLLNSQRKDWRNSLPECLEYFSPSSQTCQTNLAQSPLPESCWRSTSTEEVSSRQGTDSPAHISLSVGRNSQASVPLSDLWEEEQYLSESPYTEYQDENCLRSILNFGEDYGMFLTNSTDSEQEICSEKQSNKILKRRSRLKQDLSPQIFGENNMKLDKSKSTLEEVHHQINGNENSFGSCHKHESLLEICQENLNILSKVRNVEKTHCHKSQQKSSQRLIRHWEHLHSEIEDMLHQCLEFTDIIASIDRVRDDLIDLSESAQVDENTVKDPEAGQVKCKSSLSQLAQLKEDLFQLNLSVHDLLCQVSMAGQRQKISLVYQCKQEVIILYRNWEDAHEKVTEADRKYQKLYYVEEAHKYIKDILTCENSDDEKIRISKNRSSDNRKYREDLLIPEKLARLQRLLEDLKHNIVTNDNTAKLVPAAAKENLTKPTKAVTKATSPPGRWTHLLPKLSFLSSLVIISVVSVSWWSFPQCCDYQSSWQVWPQLRYTNGPPPI